MRDLYADSLKRQTPSPLNLTPLLDVMLLLLIFFLLTSTFVRPTIEVDLPGATHTTLSPEHQAEITLTLTREGQLLMDGIPVSMSELNTRLTEALMQDLNRPIRLQVDKNSRFGRFIAVMDTVKGTGATQLLIETNRTFTEENDDQ